MLRNGRTSLVACLILLLIGGCASHPSTGRHPAARHDTGSPKHYVCHHTSAPISVDGRLDDHAWERAPWTDYFVDIQGDIAPRPRLRTRARMLWDDTHFYIAADIEEPHVWGTLREHDEIVFHDNDFEIFIDPDGDAREYYEIEVNVLNTIFDLLLERTYIAGGPARHEWNLAGLKSAVCVHGTLDDPSDVDQGWSVEFALPWVSLAEYARKPAPPIDGDTWRVNFSRVEWQHRVLDGRYERVPQTPEDNWVWSPQGVVNMHVPQHWAFVEFRR